MDSSNNSYQVGNNIFNSKDDVKAELLKGVVSFVITSIQSGIPVDSTNTVITPGMDDKNICGVFYSHICSGNIEECYNLLDNSVVLFSICKSYVQNKNKEVLNGMFEDPRIKMLHQDIDSYNSNIKQNNMGQFGF